MQWHTIVGLAAQRVAPLLRVLLVAGASVALLGADAAFATIAACLGSSWNNPAPPTP